MIWENLLENWPRETITNDSPGVAETRCVACVHSSSQCSRCSYIDNQVLNNQNISRQLSMTKHILISGERGTGKTTLARRIPTSQSYTIKTAYHILKQMNVSSLFDLFNQEWIIVEECTCNDILKIRDISRIYPSNHTIIFVTEEYPPEPFHHKFRVLLCSKTEASK